VPRNHLVQSKSDSMPAHASPSGFAFPYHFSISTTGGFAFRQNVFSGLSAFMISGELTDRYVSGNQQVIQSDHHIQWYFQLWTFQSKREAYAQGFWKKGMLL